MVKPGEVVWTNVQCRGQTPTPRSGHTLTGNGAGKCVLFGGCGIKSDDEYAVFNETFVLTLGEPGKWDLIEPQGDVPSPRWRHTATLLPDADGVLIFGGLCKGKRFNDTHVFSVEKREWSIKECAGTPPHPRSHHTANVVEYEPAAEGGHPEHKVIVVGGYGGPGSTRDFYLDLHLLELSTWTWVKVESMKGSVPTPRSDHTTALAGDKLYLYAGRGWTTKADVGYFGDMHVLDVKTFRWLEPELDDEEGEGEAAPAWPSLGEKVWNHSAMAIQSVPASYMFLFGGQNAPRRYGQGVGVFDTGRNRWESPKIITGAPPPAREDSPFAYDDSTKSLVLFGGWRQKWLDDVYTLNVAGICGPPYAVNSIAPESGPYTGQAPVLITGLLFKESSRINVKFATKDGKREMVVPGVYEDAHHVSCKTPNFERHGALEVNVAVSIDGEPYTVNECLYQFYLNSSAKKCVAFGPGLAPKGEVGRRNTFIIQSRDSAGHYRASGGDPLRVVIDGPSGEKQPAAQVEDTEDGRYRITYSVPVAGDYQISVFLDENPNDASVESEMPVAGCPFKVSFADVWAPNRIVGVAPRVRPHMEVGVVDGKLTVVPMDEDKDLTGAKAKAKAADDAADAAQRASDKADAAAAAAAAAAGEGEGGEAGAAAGGGEGAGADADADADAAAEGEGEAADADAAAAGDEAKKPPQYAWQVDAAAGQWRLIEGEAEVAKLLEAFAPAHAQTLKEVSAFCQAAKLPAELAEALQNPYRLCASFAARPGAPSDEPAGPPFCPAPRSNFQLAVQDGCLLLYGGTAPGAQLPLDELWQLNKKGQWRQLFAAELERDHAKGRLTAFHDGSIVELRPSELGDSLDTSRRLPIAHLAAGGSEEEMTKTLLDTVTAQMKEMSETTRGLATALGQADKADSNGNEQLLIKVKKADLEIRTRTAQYDLLFEQIAETLNYLAATGGAPADSVQQKMAKVDEMTETWVAAKKLAPTVRKTIKQAADAQGAQYAEQVASFRARVDTFAADLTLAPLFNYANGVDPSYAELDGFDRDVRKLEAEVLGIKASTDVWEMSDSLTPVKEALAGVRSEIMAVKALWDLVAVVTSTLEHWQGTLWESIDTATMEEECKLFAKTIRTMDKRVREYDVYRGLDQLVKNFLAALPCVGDLKSPSMRERHWKQLMEITGKEIPLPFPPDFALRQLLELQLHKFVDDVGEVVDRAVKEDKMEQQLSKLSMLWYGRQRGHDDEPLGPKAICFEFDQHRDTDLFLIRMAEENFDALEENQLLVQGMMASKYLATFEEEVTRWQRELSNVSDVLTMMSEVQRRWAYLETLFIGSDEVKKELPEDAERFVGIDDKFKVCLKGIGEVKNAVVASNRAGLLDDLNDMSDKLELCEKSLADFLESKKRIFPRFYFVATSMLLDILSNGNRPSIVAQNINALMQGVKAIELSGDPPSVVESVTSNEGEVVPFAKTGALPLKGKVEIYLNDLIYKMRDELRTQLGIAINDYRTSGKKRSAWLFDHIAQLVLVTTQIEWTENTEAAFDKLGAGNKQAMPRYSEEQIEMLSDLIVLVQGKLDGLQRRKIMNMITLETHSRDINLMLIRDEVASKENFKWMGQLKTYWMRYPDPSNEPDCWILNCDASFNYSYEYLGNAGRLVITPLTDRIYTTATQACHLVLGCAPAGPAGTGKTETTKDLSAQLGKAVYVVNCGPEMDYRTMGDQFKGLASAGAWGCFDEYNRLLAEVLSVNSIQYKAVLDAIRARSPTFRMEGVDYTLHPDGCMAFITMNPGYLGRTELPESLKVLFRPVTVMVPDMQMIMENMLMAEGYTTANTLAKKFFTLYRLLKDLLSPQMHYDWGLRAIKSVLVVAGGFKRGEPDQPEGGLLMRALRDFNLPKIVEDDMVVFMGLLKDLWPDVFDSMPRKRDHEFEALVTSVAVESNLQPSDYFVQNVVDLQDLLDIRHCVFEIGSSGNNKTKTWQTLAKVWTKGGHRGKTTFRDINPKAITPNELYGYVNMATREWKDGLLSSTMREMANMPDTNPKWIILDGDLDANWIENMNSVMDDNRLLTLASNERIRLLTHMRMIFEIRDLAYASPATVTRAGILFISELAQWKNFVKSWIAEFKENESGAIKPDMREKRAATLQGLFDKYCEPTMDELRRNFTPVVPILDFNMVQTLCYFLEGLLVEENVGRDDGRFEIFFVLAAVWAFGSFFTITSGTDYRKRFSGWWKETWKTVKFPHRGEVFDFFVDKEKGEFAAWADIVPTLAYDSATPMSAVTVPTGETVAITFWLDNLMPRKHPAMLLGPAGCGKTAIINGKLRALGEDYVTASVNVNYYTNSSLFLKILEAPLEKKAGKNYGPPGSKKLVYFVDDLNMAALDAYNTASNIALMRQHCAYGHVYDMTKLTQKVLLNTQYLAAMNPTAGSFVVNPRLQRLFATFAVGFPGAEALTTIYQTFLNGHLSNFSKEIEEAEMGKRVVQAALQLHRKVAANFRKTASNFHYEFNIRHMAGVFQGMLMGAKDVFKEPLRLAQLWLHESERVYGDRLVSPQDLKKYKDLAAEVAKKVFREMSPTTLMAEPLIVCHFAQGIGDKVYDKVATMADVSATLTQALSEYNETNAVMNLVLFEDAIRHICRISRIIESPGGHALLVGVGGSGKQSLSKLASYASAFSVFQVVISATYGVNELKADLQTMYRKSGLKSEQMVFLFTDQQIADERFLVYLNDMLSSGEIPGLFPPEDIDDIVNGVRPNVKRSGLPDTRENCWAYFISQVRANLHAVLCFSPIGDPIKVRTRRFPALVNCVVIDWFQPWPEEALLSVSKRFLGDLELGPDEQKANVISFMPYSFVAVNEASLAYIEQERRYNWTTPKSFLELIALYKSMLAKRRDDVQGSITRLSNGVTKLELTAGEVGQLEEELKVKQVEVEEKKMQVDAMIPKLEAEKAKAADEAAKANVIATAAAEKEVAVSDMKANIERDLAAAEPALLKAAAALDSLNKKDLGELKSLAKPPAGIDDVTGACVYLLHDGSKGKIDVSWKASQQLMKDVNKFLDELLTFKDKIDTGKVSKQNFKNIRPLLEKEWFNVDTMRTKSSAAAGLCDWVLNITVYWDINENVEPMRDAAANAVTQLEQAIEAKNNAIASKEAAEATVAELTAAYNAAVAEKDAVLAEADACLRKLGLAQRLMSALGSEGERWKSTVASLNASLPILIGDALLAAAFVSYNGCFNRHFREVLTKKKFLPFLQGEVKSAPGGVAMGDDPDPLKILTNDAEIAAWSNDGLPTDRISVENGTIVTNCARWPLMIDPQLQGITWIKKKEERRGLHVVRLGQKQLIPKLENALESGKPIVIENIQTSIDAVLAPVIGRQVTRRGRTVFVKLGDKEVDYHPDFKLYLQTKLSNPHYPPEIQAEATLINFMVTEDGLEDQLLALTVLKERPDLEEQKAILIAQMNGFKIKTKELEDGILEQLANAEGDILENIALIENLEDSKRVALEIAEKAKVAQVTEVEINTAREMYRRVAARGSLMFFLLATLNKVHTFYHFSLSSFNTIVERAITGRRGKLVWNEEALMSGIAPAKLKRALLDEAAETKKTIVAEEPEKLEERMNFLVDNITFKVFDATRRGLLERHKLILATQLLLKVMSKSGELNDAEAEYLVSGRSSMTPPQMTTKVQEFLTPKQWASACALRELDAFKALTEELELATDAWSEWLNFERPEAEELPGDWGKKLNAFQQLLILRALRQDRVTTALTSFIEAKLGARYTQQAPFDMDDTFNDSSFRQPLFFVLFPGVDPGVAIEKLGRKLGFTSEGGNYVSISMGQGQEKNAENTIDRFAKDGGWVFLQNIHLMSTWLPTLDRKLEIVGDSGHEDFRAFLSAEPPPPLLEHEMQTVPEGVLQASIKVANEPPTDLKATLRSSYALFDQATLDASTKPKAHRPMIFALAFFHSLVLGRRKFGFQGFSRNYPFNNGDITVCADVLHNYVEGRDNLPWADLKYIWGEIMYGGHITDSWDRRCMSAYLEVLLVDELVDEKSSFQLAPGFSPLLEGDFASYRAYIEDAMPAESPTLFGLHPNAEIGLLISNCDALFKAIFTLAGGSASGGGINKEQKVKDLIVEMQAALPVPFAMLEVKARVKEKTPYVVFVLQELERMNAILGLMGGGMRELELGLSGALNISDAMDALIGFLFVNSVPPSWLKMCGQIGPTGNYNRKNLADWFINLKERHEQLDEWQKDPYTRPPSVWIAGLFNPMGYVTACLQMTARAKALPLDSMMISTAVMPFFGNEVSAQPDEGTYVHGLFMEGAKWSRDHNSVYESDPKELHPTMPVIQVQGVTAEEKEELAKSSGDITYECPVYTTTIRGPTFTFAAPLRTNKPPWVWILAGVCLVMQPD